MGCVLCEVRTENLYSVLGVHGGAVGWRHWATNRKVADAIPGGVEIFHLINPSGCTMTQPLTDMSTGGISWGIKVAGAQG
jgi:hypothetical protein